MPDTPMPKETPRTRPWPVFVVCGPSREYYYGDPPPPRELGYMEFDEWAEAQRGKRRRPRGKP